MKSGPSQHPSESAATSPLHLAEQYGNPWNDSHDPNLTQGLTMLSKWRHRFSHRGKSVCIFKRADSKAAPYYVKISRGKKHFKQSLETPIQDVAVRRAKQFIDDVDEQKWEDVERRKIRHRASSLADILKVYRSSHGLKQRSARNNELAMLTVLKRVTGKTVDPKRVTLAFITSDLAVRFQDTVCAEYCAAAERDDASQREARERAFRSSHSTLNQARSLFTRQAEHDLVEIYKKAGLHIPDCVTEFMTVKLRGARLKKDYHPPSDAIIERTFARIEELKEVDPEVYKAFWLDIGAALRRSEFLCVERSHLIERDGSVWISGGIGKDGEVINVPIQTRAWEALKPMLPTSGRIIRGGSEVAKRLNHWLRFQGWTTQKKAHELRAYVGSLIYQRDPRSAMAFMRHKSFAVTERFYVRYGKSKPVDVL